MVRWRAPGERLQLRAAGAEMGPAEGPLALRFYATPALADDLWLLRRSYAPFRLRQGDLELTFHGQGLTPAGPVERRLLTEWTRAVAAEVAGGAEERSFGLVLSAHGEGGAFPCDEVSVSLSGAVWAEPCPWGGGVRARLDPGRLGQLYDWFDTLAPFQMTPGSAVESPDSAEDLRLVFAGRGRRAATAAERAEIRGFSQGLARELRVRRPQAAGVTAPEPVGSSLLLPADLAAGGRPAALLLDLPKEAPLPPG